MAAFMSPVDTRIQQYSCGMKSTSWNQLDGYDTGVCSIDAPCAASSARSKKALFPALFSYGSLQGEHRNWLPNTMIARVLRTATKPSREFSRESLVR
jgi:hypothetical protein